MADSLKNYGYCEPFRLIDKDQKGSLFLDYEFKHRKLEKLTFRILINQKIKLRKHKTTN